VFQGGSITTHRPNHSCSGSIHYISPCCSRWACRVSTDLAGRSLLLLWFEQLSDAAAREDNSDCQIDDRWFGEHLDHVSWTIVVEKQNLKQRFLKCTLWAILTWIETVTMTSSLGNDFGLTGQPMMRSPIPSRCLLVSVYSHQ